MVNGFGNTSYSDKKNQFSWQGIVIRYFHCFYEVSNPVNIIAIMSWYGFVTRMVFVRAELACFEGSELLLGSFKEFRGGK